MVARVMERRIHKQICDYFNTEKLLNENQWRFRSLHFTVLALYDCSSDWLNFSVDKCMINSVVFLDISKAFDTVDHKYYINKLFYYGIEKDELSFFNNILDGVQDTPVDGSKKTPHPPS